MDWEAEFSKLLVKKLGMENLFNKIYQSFKTVLPFLSEEDVYRIIHPSISSPVIQIDSDSEGVFLSIKFLTNAKEITEKILGSLEKNGVDYELDYHHGWYIYILTEK